VVAEAFGQLTGYAFSAGDAAQRMVSFELNRCQHTTEQERASLVGALRNDSACNPREA